MRSAFAMRTKHLKRISSRVPHNNVDHIAFWKPALLLLSKENEAQLFFEKKRILKSD